MTATAPLQPEPVICRGCGHDYVEHGSDLLGCLWNADQSIDGHMSLPCGCGGFVAEQPDPECRCGSPLSMHGPAGCEENLGIDSPRENALTVFCSCEKFEAK